MPIGITGRSDTNVYKQNECKNPIFESREEMSHALSKLSYGNFHVIGNLWVKAMRSVLVGSKMCLIPTVHAAKEEPPKKPPKMKYKELPLYDRPHYEYKEYNADEEYKCLGENPKILQSALKPIVGSWRRDIFKNCTSFVTFVKDAFCELSQDIVKYKNDFKCYMRSQDYELRRALVVVATSAGFLLASRKQKYLYKKLFWATVGALSTGYLCFPKETDETFREVCYEGDKLFLIMYNFWTRENKKMPLLGPCVKDMPPVPPKRYVETKHQCPPPKVPQKPPPPKPQPPPPQKDICVEQKRY